MKKRLLTIIQQIGRIKWLWYHVFQLKTLQLADQFPQYI